jgi:hypothetical protein
MTEKKKNSWSGQIKESYLTPTPIIWYSLQLLFIAILCKLCSLARRGFLASGGQPGARFYTKHTKKPFPGHDLQLLKISLTLVQWFGLLPRAHTHTHTHTHTPHPPTHTQTHTHRHNPKQTHTHTHTHIHTHPPTHTHPHTNTNLDQHVGT